MGNMCSRKVAQVDKPVLESAAVPPPPPPPPPPSQAGPVPERKRSIQAALFPDLQCWELVGELNPEEWVQNTVRCPRTALLVQPNRALSAGVSTSRAPIAVAGGREGGCWRAARRAAAGGSDAWRRGEARSCAEDGGVCL